MAAEMFYTDDITSVPKFFDKDEFKYLIKGIEHAIPKIKKDITRIENNPKNEGQATYSLQIEDLYRSKRRFEKLKASLEKEIEGDK